LHKITDERQKSNGSNVMNRVHNWQKSFKVDEG